MTRVAATVLALLALLPASAEAFEGETPPEFGHLLPGAHAFALTAGPDGNVWFAGPRVGGDALVVGKVTPDGEVTEYQRPSTGFAYSIVAGPDRNLWFVEWGKGAIGRITTEGDPTSFPLPDANAHPTAITAGPDGNLWFTEGAPSAIGRITPSGRITVFPLPPGRHPSAITTGADGNLWFTERTGNRIGRITLSGRITEFPIPGPDRKPLAIASGPDGNLWFAEEEAAQIGRITPRGAIAQFSIPTPIGAKAIVSGPEGKLWFAADAQIGAIAPDGTVSWPACLLQYCRESPAALAVGPEGALWTSTGYRMCKGLCGGGSAIGLTLLPGGIGRYELPPVKLGIGPRATPIRHGATRVLLVCGLPGGCSGQLRLTRPHWRHGHRHDLVLGEAAYSLSQHETRRVSVPLSRRALREVREWSAESATRYPYSALAEAGPPGAIEARRGGIGLAFAHQR